ETMSDLQATNTPEPELEATNTPQPEPETTATPEQEAMGALDIPDSFSFYEDPDGRFELELPDGWEIDSSREASVLAFSPSGQASIGVFAISGSAVYGEEELTRFGELYLESFFDNYDVTVNNAETQSDDSIFYDFTLTNSEATLEGIMYGEQRGLDLFQFIALADQDVWGDYFEGAFSPVIGSYLVTPLNTETYLSDPLALTNYDDSAGLFTISLPSDWELETDDGFFISSVSGREAIIFHVTYPGDIEGVGAEAAASDLLGRIYEDGYEIEEVSPTDSGNYSATFTALSGGKDVRGFLLMSQGNEFVYNLLFQAETSDWWGLLDTYVEVLGSYTRTPPEPTVQATPTPEPEPASPFVPQAGRSRVYLVNEYNHELTFTINNQEIKVPAAAGAENPTTVDLDANRYTYTISIPFGSVNGEVTMGPDQSWAIRVTADGGVTNPFQIYP
ncbi:MAG: hypothetical protein AAF629_31125, partial [Chloroflexota bacterium]